jgi:hypothetical protein
VIHIRGSLIVATALAFAAACGGEERESSKAHAEPQRANAHPLFGTYRAALSTSDPDVPDGIWTLVLRPGRFSTAVTTSPQVNRGRLDISENELTLLGETPACVDDVGRYRWSLDGRTLRLEVVARDPCSGNDRTIVLTSKPWTKRG